MAAKASDEINTFPAMMFLLFSLMQKWAFVGLLLLRGLDRIDRRRTDEVERVERMFMFMS